MKKSTLSILLFLFISHAVNAQNVYYDALALRKYLDGTGKFLQDQPSRDVYLPILARYLPKSVLDASNGTPDQAAVGTFFDANNPFLRGKGLGTFALGASLPMGAILGSIGNLDVTAFADGLAQFLVERTKEELNANFFRKFKDLLDERPELKSLFPNTSVFVDSFESWDYSNLLNTLREAFDKDCKLILSSVVTLKDLKETDCPDDSQECKDRVKSLLAFLQTNEGKLLLTAFQMGNGLVQTNKLPDILNSISTPEFVLGITFPDAAVDKNFKNSFKLTNIMSMGLKSIESSRHYITEKELAGIFNDADLQNLYLALLWQQISNEVIEIGGVKIVDVLTPGHVDGTKQYLIHLVNESKNLQLAYEKLLRDRAEGKDTKDDFGALFEMTQRVLQAATTVSLIDSRIAFPPKINEFFDITADVLQVAHDIAVRNYNAVVLGVLKILSDHIEKTTLGEGDKNYLHQFTSTYLKYGSFAANVVNSPTAEDVKEAIKAVSLPSGSASIKKHSNFNISLNSYVGFVYGDDKPVKDTYTTTDSNGKLDTVALNGGKTIGVYAPVGVGLNWGLGWQTKNPWSVSAFISIIDVGALVGYRFVNDSTISQDIEIKLSNIFAPGANLVFGIPNVPISVGGGAQWIPTLQRNPSSNDLYNIDHSGIRWQVFVAVDIPMMNFHTGKKTLTQGGQVRSAAKKKTSKKKNKPQVPIEG